MLSSVNGAVAYALQPNDMSRKNNPDTSNVSFKDTLSQALGG